MVFVLLSFGSPSVCTHICAWEQKKEPHALSKMTEFGIHFKTLKLQMASQGWPLCDTITLLLNLPFLFLHDFHWGKLRWKQQLFYKHYSPGSDCLPRLSIKCRLCWVKIPCQGQYIPGRVSLNILGFIALFGQNQITLPLLIRRFNLHASLLCFLLLVLLGIFE